MEYVLVASIIGAGYLMGQNYNKKKYKGFDEVDPSNTDIYKRTYLENVKNKESTLSNKQFNKAKHPLKTNVIPPQFNNRIINTQNNSVKYLQYPKNKNDHDSDIFISKLSGKKISANEFTHNNMSPFFGSNVRQNTYEYANQPILELYTGSDKLNTNKKEIEPMFKPSHNISNIHGTANNTSKLLEHYYPSQKKTNETPIEKIIVGPGLNNGYTNLPSGGFNQSNTLDFIRPKSVDETRVLSNPKISFKGRIIPGKSITQNISKIGKVDKHRPDTVFKHGPKRLFTTVGAQTKNKARSCIVIKDTNRKQARSYHGPGDSSNKATKHRSLYRKSTKNIYKKNNPRNANLTEYWSKTNKLNDYGKQSHHLPSNERDITGKRTHTTNITSIVKAIIAPVQDVLKTSKKENVIGNPRQAGNFNAANIKKHTIWDPNDVARTTIKETNIHDTRSGNINIPNKLSVYDPNDIARTTIKETNIHDVRSGNIQTTTNHKGTVYDPNDVARTTIKETNIHNVRSGHMDVRDRGFVYDPNDVAKTTIKETNIHDVRSGHMDVRDRGFVYDPNDVARTTIKETNIHDNRSGYMDVRDRGVVYDPNDVARTTIKETNIHDNRTGHMDVRDRGFVYDPNDVARTTIKETNIHDIRTGNIQTTTNHKGLVIDPSDIPNTTMKETTIYNRRSGNINGQQKTTVYDPNDVAKTTMKETSIHDVRSGHMGVNNRGFVYDPNDIARTTIKETNIDNQRIGNISNLEGIEGGYITNPANAPNTNRQFTTDKYTGIVDSDMGGGNGYLTNKHNAPNTNRQFTTTDYTGTADSNNNKPRSYQDIYNMTLNQVREGTLKGRNPTPSNVTLSNGRDSVHLDIKKIETDYINKRIPNTTKIYNNGEQINKCSVTTYKDQLENKPLINRIEPKILNAFRKNPYTQRLDSYTFP